MNHEEFEKKLMEMLLAGDDPVLEGLRFQYRESTVEPATFTGAGFYTHFKIKPGVAPVAGGKTFQIGDINASFGDVSEAFGFILFIKNGYLLMLEGYTLSYDTWPGDYANVTLVYNDGKRELQKLRASWNWQHIVDQPIVD